MKVREKLFGIMVPQPIIRVCKLNYTLVSDRFQGGLARASARTTKGQMRGGPGSGLPGFGVELMEDVLELQGESVWPVDEQQEYQ
jgi:hypothetical protein